MKLKRKQKPLPFLAVLMFMIALPFGSANAMSFDVGKGTFDMDVQLIYAAQFRVEDPHPNNLVDFNADDGNQNFDQWDMTSNRFSMIVDNDLNFNDYGIFVRYKGFYDFVYMTDNANDSPETNNNLIGGLTNKTDEFSDDVEDVHGRNMELLDYFALVIYNTIG